MFNDSNIVDEVAERTCAIGYGVIGAVHKMIRKLRLDREIDKNIELLTFHVFCHQSDPY